MSYRMGAAKPFRFCATCGKSHPGTLIPSGWYSAMRYHESRQHRPVRLGIWCSAECMANAMPRLERIEDQLGEAFGHEPEREAQS